MDKPWEFKSDDTRLPDVLYTFIIFCEDEVSEYIYFKWFETSLIKINIINRQKSMMSNVIKAIAYCEENGILIKDKTKYTLNVQDLEIWCVYDRDQDSNSQDAQEKNIEFNVSILTAEEHGINVAWSNDAFELWILLHFIDIDHNDPKYYERKHYYDQLTEIFKTHSAPNDELKKALVHASFSYKKDLKQKNNFKEIVRPEIIINTNVAIERAKKLVEIHKLKSNYFDMKPCTMVFKLIESIIEKGGKKQTI